MSRFLQALESRTLFAVDFVAAQAQVVADAAAARAALKSASAGMAADVRMISADVRAAATPANRATNAGLLRTLKADFATTRATLRADSMPLLRTGTALSRRVAASARALILNPGNPKFLAKLAADVPTLQAMIQAQTATLQTDLQNITLDADLAAIVTANPGNAALSADADAALANGQAAFVAFGNAAMTFATDVGALITDLDQLPKVPNVVGNYSGTARQTTGSDVGAKYSLTLNITGEGDDGALTGSATLSQAGQLLNSYAFSGSVASDGTLNGSVNDTANSTQYATLVGHVTGKTIAGTYASSDSGVFSLTRQG